MTVESINSSSYMLIFIEPSSRSFSLALDEGFITFIEQDCSALACRHSIPKAVRPEYP